MQRGRAPRRECERVPHKLYFLPSHRERNEDSIPPQLRIMEDQDTKGQRRDDKRRKRRKMRVVGRSVRLLQQIIKRKSDDAHEKDRQ